MRIPGFGILKGLRQTGRNYWAPKVTNQYPESRPTMPDRWRGRLDLIYDPFGEHKCEVCFQCAQVCPVEAIDMSGFDSSGARIRYGMPEYSVNGPATSSLSASTMSNGVRFTSAREAM